MKNPRVFLLFAVMILLFAFPVSAEQAEEPDEWTVLIYMCGSDLESKYSFGTMNLEEILPKVFARNSRRDPRRS